MPEEYCIKWNDFNSHLGLIFSDLFSTEQDADVTLRAQGSSFKCHKVVLSTSSPYFHEVLGNATSSHPVIILAGVKAADIETIVDFMYHGEIKNISYERFVSVLKTAELLKINGLTEVSIFQTIVQSPGESLDECTKEEDNIVLINETVYTNVEEEKIGTEHSKLSLPASDDDQLERRRKSKDSKKYSEGIDRALQDMEWGMSLMEASRLHKIPRSTLYSKAKHHSGLQIVSRKEHSNQDCHLALQAIAGGMSLKRAAEEFNIPKTVLWRRVQKRFDVLSKVKCRKKSGNKSTRDYEDSVKHTLDDNKSHINIKSESSENNENLALQNENKNSSKKIRLSQAVEACKTGKMSQATASSTFQIKSESSENNENLALQNENKNSSKKIRLSQAVEACKTGKMSQATASSTFQVPKTTIWRRLQKYSTQEEIKPQIVIEKEDHHYTVPNDNKEYDGSSSEQ